MKPSFDTPENESPRERGRRWGAHFKAEGINYGKVHGHYPSCPYHISDPRCAEYSTGYEEGFNEMA